MRRSSKLQVVARVRRIRELQLREQLAQAQAEEQAALLAEEDTHRLHATYAQPPTGVTGQGLRQHIAFRQKLDELKGFRRQQSRTAQENSRRTAYAWQLSRQQRQLLDNVVADTLTTERKQVERKRRRATVPVASHKQHT